MSMVLQLPLAFVGNNVFFLFSFVFLWSVLCFNYQYIACWQEIQPHCLEQTVQYLSYNSLFFWIISEWNPYLLWFASHIMKDSCFYLLLYQNDLLNSEQIFQFHSQMGQMEELTSAATRIPSEMLLTRFKPWLPWGPFYHLWQGMLEEQQW